MKRYKKTTQSQTKDKYKYTDLLSGSKRQHPLRPSLSQHGQSYRISLHYDLADQVHDYILQYITRHRIASVSFAEILEDLVRIGLAVRTGQLAHQLDDDTAQIIADLAQQEEGRRARKVQQERDDESPD